MHIYALNCTLKSGPISSSTDTIIDLVARELVPFDIGLTRDRVADHDIRPEVTSDERGRPVPTVGARFRS